MDAEEPGPLITLRLRGLAAGRGGRLVVPPLDLVLGPGSALLVTGANGAGKSTLLRTLAGLLPPLAGEVSVEGAVAADGEPARRVAEVAHYLGHRNSLKAGRSVAEELGFWRRFLGDTGLGVREALAAVDLGAAGDLPAGVLSAGQGRRAAMARLLVSERPVWILDEPTAALDERAQARFAALCRERQCTGGIVIAATHQPLALEAPQELRLEALRPAGVGEAAAAAPGGGWDELW